MVGTAVLRMVVSSDSMKKATAMSHGRRRRLESASVAGEGAEGGARWDWLCRRWRERLGAWLGAFVGWAETHEGF